MIMFNILLVLGCPEPVDFSDRTVDNSTVQANSQEEAPSFTAANNTGRRINKRNTPNHAQCTGRGSTRDHNT